MSKKIQEALDLPTLENLLRTSAQDTAAVNAEPEQDIPEDDQDQMAMQLGAALGAGALPPQVAEDAQAKDHADSMDVVYGETLQHARDLMDLGYNVDTRSAGRIFENAANMYKIAIEAKNSKRKAQFDKTKLEQEQQKIDIVERKARGENDSESNSGALDTGSVVIEDRNELIRRLRGD
jgi:hypothetical protein